MNTYYGIRSLRPARLFSFGLLDVLQRVRLRRPHLREASAGFGFGKTQPPHHSAAFANVTLVIPRVADLATAFTDNAS
jgi:hypothetical protein